MILSFSVPEMLPYIRSGLVQSKGVSVGNVRVKRQTIRKWGPQAERILKLIETAGEFPYRASHWWKVRTREREYLGGAEADQMNGYALGIERSPAGAVFVRGGAAWGAPDRMLWDERTGEDIGVSDFAYADGFDSPEAFRDYFVPNPADVFKGILYKW